MKKKNPSKIRSLVIIVLLIVIVYSVVKWKKKNDAKNTVQNITRSSSSTVTPVTPTVVTTSSGSSGSGNSNWQFKWLQRGSRGPEVTALQNLINKNRDLFKMKHVGVDGVYGPEVETAVQRMTNKKGTNFHTIKKIYEYNFKKQNNTTRPPSFTDVAVQGASTIANSLWNPLSLLGLT